ncbi:MAG: 2Fe-2S iron-sulfur cluster-binding protein [Pseudomonadota bacterium]
MEKIEITIDGKQVKAKAGERLLDVLRREGIFIPTLCDHEDLQPYGVCRLCIVEWDRGDWAKVITSCNFPVKDGQIFRTKTEKIIRQRKMVMELTLARASKTPEVIELAKKMGVTSTRFPTKDEGCILCGNCIRACSEIVEVDAICFAARGPDRKVSSPFFQEAIDCIGCGSCAYVCPTNYIKVEEDDKVRKFPLWNVEFEMAHCKKCGQKIAPKKQLEYLRQKANLAEDWFDLCNNCR